MNKTKIGDMGRIALLSAIISVCSWVTVPYVVPFTLQTFAVLVAAGMLGGKKAALSVAVYILLGAFGLPVFSGMRGGVGVLLGATGGYLIGFLPCAYIAGVLCAKTKKRPILMCLSMAVGLLCDYAFGVLWFYSVYLNGSQSLIETVVTCVLPFVGVDAVKIILAVLVSAKLQKNL